MKKKLAKVNKYQYGGDINDPDYLEYLKQTGQSIDSVNNQNSQFNSTVAKNNNNYETASMIGAGATSVASAINPIAGVVVGGISNVLLGNQKAKNDEYLNEQKIKENEELKKQQKFYTDKSNLSDLHGKQNVQLFGKNGMTIPKSNIDSTTGGYMKPLAKGVHKIEGNSHEEGGVGLIKNGTKFAEVEGGEVKLDNENKETIVTDSIYIRPGVTFADEATKLGKMKGRLESMKTTDTNSFLLDRVKAKLARLPEEQEMVKKSMGIVDSTMGKNGIDDLKLVSGDINSDINDYYDNVDKNNQYDFQSLAMNDNNSNQIPRVGSELPIEKSTFQPKYNPYAKSLKPFKLDDNRFANLNTTDLQNEARSINNTPNLSNTSMDYDKVLSTAANVGRFVDNYYNDKLTNETPELSKPNLQKAEKLDTEFSIDANLNENRTDYKDYAKAIDANTSNSNVATSRKGMAYAEKIKANNQLFTQKTNIETGLKNQDKLNRQAVNANNLAKIDDYNNNEYNRKLMIQGRKSANITNAVEDLTNINAERNQKVLDNSKISHIGKLYNDNDASATTLYSEYRNAARTSGEIDDLKKSMSKTKKGKEDWNKDSRNKNNLIVD